MVLRRQSGSDSPASGKGVVRPASSVFLDTQKDCEGYEFVLQVEHSALAGQLAARLLPAAFGELPVEVIEATAKHDLGWGESDEEQLAGARAGKSLKPFPNVAEDELPSWRRSLELAESYHPLTYVLISRHFAALANRPSPQHQLYLSTENARRARKEEALPYSASQLKRWSAALGFCDLLSLYLCCGTKEPARFPFAHPADPEAASGPQVDLVWYGEQPAFTQPVFAANTQVTANAQLTGRSSAQPTLRYLEWQFKL